MQHLLRRLCVLVIALAFLAGTIGVAFAFGAEPCDGLSHASAGHEGHHHHDTTSQSCLACLCCAVIPTLPAAPAVFSAPEMVAYVSYYVASEVLAGRSIAPDPSPPRSLS